MTKVLIIEDQSQSREVFLEGLEAEGFEAIGAENGLVGVHKAQEVLPDLVVCDILMPKLDGYGVLTTLRQNPATAIIPFIFLTAKATRAELRQGMKLGADDYIIKPFTVEELLEAIAIRLEKQATIRQWYANEFQQGSETSKPEAFFPNNPELREVFDFIEANYHQSISLSDVAEAVGYSAAYLTDLVKRRTGQTVNRWIIKRRMAAAEALLLDTNQSMEEIAEEVGYLNPGHFFRQFRQHHRTTPHVWRKAQYQS